jgi:hypothetical protein
MLNGLFYRMETPTDALRQRGCHGKGFELDKVKVDWKVQIPVDICKRSLGNTQRRPRILYSRKIRVNNISVFDIKTNVLRGCDKLQQMHNESTLFAGQCPMCSKFQALHELKQSRYHQSILT